MQTGQRIGRYDLVKKIGRGGMAEIFRADETLPDGGLRTVAVKRLFPKLSAEREFVGMFVNEARIASGMQHPNIVQTFDLINYGSYYYIVMEYLEGVDLEALLAHRVPGELLLPVEEVAFVVHEVAMGLAYAHGGGARSGGGPVVHRDISAGNILIGCAGQVKITDFGIARAMQYASFTRPGVLKGKYEYMSPEYVKGEAFDGRADLFSLGVLTYELLSGENPFAAVLPKDTWQRITEHHPKPPGSLVTGIPRELDQAVAWMLEKDPDKRVPNGLELADRMKPLFSHPGRQEVAASLGQRAARLMDKEAPSVTSVSDVRKFLPPEDQTEATSEVHLDELLELVEPVSVPHIVVGEEASESSITAREPAPGLAGRRRKWLLGAVVLVVLLALGGGITWWLWPQPTGRLSVTSSLRAEVYVDGTRMGLAPVNLLPITAGSHIIEVRRPGRSQFRRYRRIIQEGKHTRIRVKWKRNRQKRTRRKRHR